MSVKVYIPHNMEHLTNCTQVVEVEGATVGGCLQHLVRQFPDIKKELLSPCGLYCGVCAVYIAHNSNDDEFKKQILPIFEEWGANTIDDIACEGCLSADIIFPFCQTCAIKKCTKEKKIKGCHQCDEFPCEIIEKWPSLEGKQVMLKEIPIWREIGTEDWVKNIENCNIINIFLVFVFIIPDFKVLKNTLCSKIVKIDNISQVFLKKNNEFQIIIWHNFG